MLRLQVTPALQQLALPCGHNVQLQKLVVSTHDDQHQLLVLEHLSLASSLKHLEFDGVSPRNLHEDGWPQNMPRLQGVDLLNLQCDPPHDLLRYQQLTVLDLSGLATPTFKLPDWFSGMTQLKVLRLNDCHFAAFPSCLFALSQLECLCMEGICPAMTIPKEIVSLDQWHCLQRLDLTVNDVQQGQYCLESRLHVLELAHLFEIRPVSFLFGSY